jgi:hypothetical protein
LTKLEPELLVEFVAQPVLLGLELELLELLAALLVGRLLAWPGAVGGPLLLGHLEEVVVQRVAVGLIYHCSWNSGLFV